MLRGCGDGTSEYGCIDKADGDAGCRGEPTNTLNEPSELVVTSIGLEDTSDSGIPRIGVQTTRTVLETKRMPQKAKRTRRTMLKQLG